MTTSRFYLCAVPASAWEGAGLLAAFAADLLACERRIAKKINLADEQTRYNLISQRLESAATSSGKLQGVRDEAAFRAALASGRYPIQALHPGYLDVLARLASSGRVARSAASFFPPEKVAIHLREFQLFATQAGLAHLPVVRQRLAFFGYAVRENCGVVELQSSFHLAADAAVDPAFSTAVRPPGPGISQIQIPDFAATELEMESLGQGKKAHMARILSQQIRDSLRTGEPVSVGSQASHDVLTEVLNMFVFVPAGEQPSPVSLRIVYADGSEAQPFPLLCLVRRDLPAAGPPVRELSAALMSMRHFELDPVVDFCWLRNREVSRSRTLAESDAFCTEETIRQLATAIQRGGLLLQLYHTGFEPAVIGFYRALVRVLLANPARRHVLGVTPRYFKGNDNPYVPGAAWC